MAETVIAQFPDGRFLVKATFSGPSSYSTGGFSQSITSFRKIEAVISISNDGGYKVDPAEITIGAGSITVKVREYYYTCGGPDAAIEVASGKDLSGVTFQAILLGF